VERGKKFGAERRAGEKWELLGRVRFPSPWPVILSAAAVRKRLLRESMTKRETGGISVRRFVQ